MTETNIFKKDEIDTTFPVMIPIGHNVALIDKEWSVNINNPAEKVKLLKEVARNKMLFHVINAKKIFNKVTSVASASLPATTASFDMGDISEWLETSKSTFYDVNVGFISDTWIEWEIKYPKGQQIGGTKETPEIRLTQDDSHYLNPKLNFIVWEDDWIPSFKVFNQDGSTPRFVKIRAIGWKYKFILIKEEDVNLNTFVTYKILPEVTVA